jgi:NitT/TauT family transport system ATP-binding protein
MRDVSKGFPNPEARGKREAVVDSISLLIPDVAGAGEFIVFLGPSGCGKSTLLNMIGGLLQPDTGEVRTFGKPVTGPNPDAVTVFQHYTCFPWLTALGNVEYSLKLQGGLSRGERRARAADYLKRVGLEHKENAYPRELSGGQQQRVAIARTLVISPRIVLMDEPFGALDAQTRQEMQQMLLSLWGELHNLIVFVTHDVTEAILLADRIFVLSARPARIIGDFRVPFLRPRRVEATREEAFQQLSAQLIQLLRQAPAAGEVRVSV